MMIMAQMLSIMIFITMFVLIVIDKFEKQYVTLGCGCLTLVLVFGVAMHDMTAVWNTLNVQSIFTKNFWYTVQSNHNSTGINWETIIFLLGMMIMVEGMSYVGFFRWLCLKLAKIVNYRPLPLFITFMIMSAVLAMFIDSITVILFLAAVSVELANLLKIDPIPMILAEIFCANLGGSATMCGDPPNIIIGTSLGYAFSDFFTNTGVIALFGLIVIIVYFYLAYRKELQEESKNQIDTSNIPVPKEAITSKKDFVKSCIIFTCAVGLLITHAMIGLTVAFIGTFIASITLICFAKNSKELLAKVDYKMLLFFLGLFIVVSGLEQTGILEIMAAFIGKISGGNPKLMIAIIIWVSAIASAFVDNIPFSATMIPIIKSLTAMHGVDLDTLVWALSIGTDIGGSATPIGASANVVGISVAGKNGYTIGWEKYCKVSVPATIIVITLSMIIIFIRYC